MNKQEYQKGSLLGSGKTKEIYIAALVEDGGIVDETMVIVKNKRDVTAFNDEDMTQQMEEKDVFATNTACRVFELLRDCGIPVAYEKQLSPTEFLAKKCVMINLEIIGRRYVRKGSSYLNRNPGLQLNLEGDAFRFRNLKVELFLKTTKGKLVIDGKTLIEGLAKKDDDPIIADTKFEFGLLDGKIVVIDEVLTPDSSRFWPRKGYEPGGPQPSFDKQYLRDYLESLDWDKTAPGPRLPMEVIGKTSEKYQQALALLSAPLNNLK